MTPPVGWNLLRSATTNFFFFFFFKRENVITPATTLQQAGSLFSDAAAAPKHPFSAMSAGEELGLLAKITNEGYRLSFPPSNTDPTSH